MIEFNIIYILYLYIYIYYKMNKMKMLFISPQTHFNEIKIKSAHPPLQMRGSSSRSLFSLKDLMSQSSTGGSCRSCGGN